MAQPDIIEDTFIEPGFFQEVGFSDGRRRRLIAVPPERRLLAVPPERRLIAVPRQKD